MDEHSVIPSYELFSINGEESIMEPEHLGIFNGMVTTNTTYRDVLSFRNLVAPPYVSSDFTLEIRLFGEKVNTRKYKWYPFKIERKGKIREIAIQSSLVLVDGVRAGILAITLENQGAREEKIPLQFNITGGVDYINFYGFLFPLGVKKCTTICQNGKLIKRNDSGAIVVVTDLKNLRWEEFSSHWETTVALAAKTSKTIHVVVGIGALPEVEFDCERILSHPLKSMEETHEAWEKKTNALFTKIPRLEANNEGLVKFYNRSLLPFLLNRWEVPEFLLHPYYSSGGINGGCIGLYLWDWGEVCEIFPLCDPQATREHIKQFLKNDLTAHYAISPVNGEAFGPWYPVNQEKIISSIYYYVLHTGDAQFLNEEVNGKTILDWAIYHATYRDDFSKPAVLVDYGTGNNHLELKGQYKYDNFMPDLNGKRYASYKMVSFLCKLAGKKESIDFSRRAENLKLLIKDRLWDRKERWFCWLDDTQTHKNIRYTIQMFKLFSINVLDKEEETGLLSHLNENEFLSAYGIHSMSKKDPAYDQQDIDNGGGGSFVGFPLQIIERLYKSGYFETAEDIFKRILWWGERLPYWGDSLVANNIDYRKDTPLQNCLSAIAGAQCIIFGMFGVEVKISGDIIINPHPPLFSPDINLRGLKIRGSNIDIHVKDKKYLVKIGGQVIHSKVGIPVLFKIKDKKLKKVTGLS